MSVKVIIVLKLTNLAVTLFSKCYDFQGINDFLLKKHVGSCTLSSLTLHYNLAITQSVGDSLIILIRNKKIYYLSFNQNYQTRINFLTKRKVNSNLLEHYLSNLKFESLNTNLNYFTVYPGDIIYLLSDGYQKILTPQRFIKLLKKDKLISYLHNYQKEINDDITIIKVTIRKE